MLLPTSLVLFKDISFDGFWLTKLKDKTPKEFMSIFETLVKWIADKKLKLPEAECINFGSSIEDFEKTIKKVFSNESFQKKTVLVMKDDQCN